MNSLSIPYIASPSAASLQQHGARFQVANVNWPDEFPYAPAVEGSIARSKDALWVCWKVKGKGLTVRSLGDGGPIWEDSCCEIFLQAPGSLSYYNVEVNAAGHLLLGRGTGRGDRQLLPEGMARILRFGGVAAPVDIPDELLEWQIGVVIPWEVIGLDPDNLPEKLYGNIYKCGDKTAHPHFLSWAPVHTPAPDFHRPEFFGSFNLTA